VRVCFRRAFFAVALLLFASAGIAFGARFLDRILAILILSFYILGSAVLILKTRHSSPEDRRRAFSHGELTLLPASWRRWMLDQKPRARDGVEID